MNFIFILFLPMMKITTLININLDRMLAPFRKYLEKVFESSLLSIRVSKSIYSVRYILLTKELISV